MFQLFRNPAPLSVDWASLILRLTFGGMMFSQHGWSKLTGYSEMSTKFMDFMGLGMPVSLGLTIFAEFFCGILVALGLFTRMAVIPLVITMLVALLMVHWDDPIGKKELPIFYLLAYTAIFLLGSGRYSLDALLRLRRPPVVVD